MDLADSSLAAERDLALELKCYGGLWLILPGGSSQPYIGGWTSVPEPESVTNS